MVNFQVLKQKYYQKINKMKTIIVKYFGSILLFMLGVVLYFALYNKSLNLHPIVYVGAIHLTFIPVLLNLFYIIYFLLKGKLENSIVIIYSICIVILYFIFVIISDGISVILNSTVAVNAFAYLFCSFLFLGPQK